MSKTISDIPSEILTKVFEYSFCNFRNIRLVCRHWNSVSSTLILRRLLRLRVPQRVDPSQPSFDRIFNNSNYVFPNVWINSQETIDSSDLLCKIAEIIEDLVICTGNTSHDIRNLLYLLEKSQNLKYLNVQIKDTMVNNTYTTEHKFTELNRNVHTKLQHLHIESEDSHATNVLIESFAEQISTLSSLSFGSNVIDDILPVEGIVKLIEENKRTIRTLKFVAGKEIVLQKLVNIKHLHIDKFQWVNRLADQWESIKIFLDSQKDYITELELSSAHIHVINSLIVSPYSSLRKFKVRIHGNKLEQDLIEGLRISLLNHSAQLIHLECHIKCNLEWSQNQKRNPNLQTLFIKFEHEQTIQEHAYKQIAYLYPNLHTLKLNNCVTKGMSALFNQLAHLTQLELWACMKESAVNVERNALKNLSKLKCLNQLALHDFVDLITDDLLINSFLLPNLRRLALVNAGNYITDNGVQGLVRNCPNLIELKARYCCNITDKAVAYISKYLTHLQDLDLRGAARLSRNNWNTSMNPAVAFPVFGKH